MSSHACLRQFGSLGLVAAYVFPCLPAAVWQFGAVRQFHFLKL
jgi:hypothetical protein